MLLHITFAHATRHGFATRQLPVVLLGSVWLLAASASLSHAVAPRGLALPDAFQEKQLMWELELGNHQIRVNAVCPGVIDTHRMDDLGRGDTWERVKRAIPLGRAGDGSECAEMVLFLVSERGAWITGQAINVDGGQVWGN